MSTTLTMDLHLPMEALHAGLDEIRRSPRDGGRLACIVRRPATDAREAVDRATLSVEDGLAGDNWRARGSRRMPDGTAHPDMQLTLMNARAIDLIARTPERWPLAGDQLFVDLDLSGENLPAGTRLAVGEAVIEVTTQPHTGCHKFVDRYGADAMKFVNSEVGRALNLRGIYARVVTPGAIRVGERVTKIVEAPPAG